MRSADYEDLGVLASHIQHRLGEGEPADREEFGEREHLAVPRAETP